MRRLLLLPLGERLEEEDDDEEDEDDDEIELVGVVVGFFLVVFLVPKRDVFVGHRRHVPLTSTLYPETTFANLRRLDSNAPKTLDVTRRNKESQPLLSCSLL